MAYKIKYLPLAVQDLTDIAQYLSGFYPKTAPRVLREIREKIERLSTTPNMCEEYEHDPSYRKLVADKSPEMLFGYELLFTLLMTAAPTAS